MLEQYFVSDQALYGRREESFVPGHKQACLSMDDAFRDTSFRHRCHR
jgi:hypothetical protein